MEVPHGNLEQATAARATETRLATTHVRMEVATTTANLEAAVMVQVKERMEAATAGRMEPTIDRVMEEPPESRRLLAETKTSTSHPQVEQHIKMVNSKIQSHTN